MGFPTESPAKGHRKRLLRQLKLGMGAMAAGVTMSIAPGMGHEALAVISSGESGALVGFEGVADNADKVALRAQVFAQPAPAGGTDQQIRDLQQMLTAQQDEIARLRQQSPAQYQQPGQVLNLPPFQPVGRQPQQQQGLGSPMEDESEDYWEDEWTEDDDFDEFPEAGQQGAVNGFVPQSPQPQIQPPHLPPQPGVIPLQPHLLQPADPTVRRAPRIIQQQPPQNQHIEANINVNTAGGTAQPPPMIQQPQYLQVPQPQQCNNNFGTTTNVAIETGDTSVRVAAKFRPLAEVLQPYVPNVQPAPQLQNIYCVANPMPQPPPNVKVNINLSFGEQERLSQETVMTQLNQQASVVVSAQQLNYLAASNPQMFVSTQQQAMISNEGITAMNFRSHNPNALVVVSVPQNPQHFMLVPFAEFQALVLDRMTAVTPQGAFMQQRVGVQRVGMAGMPAFPVGGGGMMMNNMQNNMQNNVFQLNFDDLLEQFGDKRERKHRKLRRRRRRRRHRGRKRRHHRSSSDSFLLDDSSGSRGHSRRRGHRGGGRDRYRHKGKGRRRSSRSRVNNSYESYEDRPSDYLPDSSASYS